ncbi:MAG TPA: hypothetical protein VFD59_05360 [Nocardioidaceae bacterium]|nr:hypothetical protein [Nocardioidaceae bacterium]
MTQAKEAAVIVAICALLGVGCGVLWWLLVDPAMITKVAEGGSVGELELGKRFDPDGWYAVIAALSGLLAGGLLTWWRSRDPILTTVLVLFGAGVAAAVMAVTGWLLGSVDPDVALAAVEVGGKVPEQLIVTAQAAYLVWPIAMLVGALMVLWSQPRERAG